MNLGLFYDTETSGFAHSSKPDSHPDQPHVVQLGGALMDLGTRKVIQSIDVIVRPQGWTISEGAISAHGITNEMAMDCGISESLALEMLIDLWEVAHTRIGHNESFDAQIVRIGMSRFGLIGPRHQRPEILMDAWSEATAICTMKMCEGVVRLGPTEKMKKAGRHHDKQVSLQEAHLHLLGEEFQDAHSAMADAMACARVYFALTNQKEIA